MSISTRNYEDTHGRKPKPGQDGHWHFTIERRDGACTPYSVMGTYREAARYAKAEAKTIGGASKIYVCS